MYLIQSNSDDKSTNDIIDWILFLNENRNDLFRLNDTIIVDNFTYQLSYKNGEHFNINNNLETLKIKSFWYRRGRFSYNDSILKTNNLLSQQLMNGIQSNFHRENKHINNCLYHILRKKGNINTFNDNFTNKIANLSAAMEIGLNIPDVLVTNNTADLINFSLIHEKIITKDIEMNAIKASYNENYNIVIEPSVKILRREDILPKNKKTKGTFSLYQQYIEKKYELRIFYLKGKFYPMAIFSQASEKTKIDFRNYDKERPNRCVPYKLPQEIEQKLICFMQSIDMNSGSIDMIYTPEGEYVFLEVNPVGQFQWLSKSCNYDIEREIALDLINETND